MLFNVYESVMIFHLGHPHMSKSHNNIQLYSTVVDSTRVTRGTHLDFNLDILHGHLDLFMS